MQSRFYNMASVKISSRLRTPGFIAHPDFHYIPLSRENILARKLRRDIPYNIS